MRISELIEKYNFSCVNDNCDMDKEITTISSCDLLSWVMAKGVEGQAWVTVQTHVNIVAVASLLDMACIIIPEGIDVEPLTKEKANEQGVYILKTDMGIYEIFKIFYSMGY
jgi:hypothetical protein